MGDIPPGTTPQSLDTTAGRPARDGHQTTPSKSPTNNSPFQAQLASISQGHVRPDGRSPAHLAGPHHPSHDQGASSLSMGAMVAALPEYGPVEPNQGHLQVHQQTHRSLSGASTSALVYQLQQNLQMPSHGSGALPTQSAYAPAQYHHNFTPSHVPQPTYGPFHPTQQQRLPHLSSIQAPYQGFHQPSQYMYYPSPYGSLGQYQHSYQGQAAQPQAQYGRRPSNPPAMPMMGQPLELAQSDGVYPSTSRLLPGAAAPGDTASGASILSGTFGATGMPRPGPISTVPRGPPRKPKQSGHALWVGNLPPGTTVIALKDHFSRDATKDIESLFLISKSNCAFVNYRTEASCTAAMHRFHDSRFNGVRLVCRLRRSSTPASGIPTGPSALQPANSSPPKSPQEVDGVQADADGVESPTRGSGDGPREGVTAKERYFIVKSLTLQDLESSVRNGIWATQSHNEEALNKAYESADSVYLIFSANKSGEYFGYARMTSPILEDATSLMGSPPKPEVIDAPDVPKAIPTPATEFAPKGRIIDDSARGTIFWEADLSESEGEEVDGDKEELQVDGDASAVAQSFGKPFKIEWISTNRLPFYRTRGLRNPWNANREVKIARDGTELETSVGERLVHMFHRLGPSGGPVPMSGPMMVPQQLGSSQLRPFSTY